MARKSAWHQSSANGGMRRARKKRRIMAALIKTAGGKKKRISGEHINQSGVIVRRSRVTISMLAKISERRKKKAV